MNVKQAKYLALTISILGFVIGFSDLQENIYFWLGRPVGAICFGIFFIFTVLEKEFALFDEEQAKVPDLADANRSKNTACSRKESSTSALTTANSH